MRRVIPITVIFLLLSTLSVRAQTPEDHDLKALTKSMESVPPAQRLAFNALLVAFETFRDAHLRHEICVATEDCAEHRATEGARLMHEFVAMARDPSIPTTGQDLTTADETLNNYFQKVSATLPETCAGSDCLSKGTFRDVQRDWIRYRDAWVTFAAARSPAVPADEWRAYLTQQRSAQLLARFHALLCCS